MRIVLQRVKWAKVESEGQLLGSIGPGYMALVGIGSEDTKDTADQYIRKMLNLRIFQDENGKTNLSLKDVGGSLLLVSQFTLYADIHKGNRPSFVKAGDPAASSELFDYMVEKCRETVPDVQCGSFGAYMQVSLCNDGPFTVVMDEHAFSLKH